MYDSILIDYGLEKAHKCYMSDLDISYPFPQTDCPSIHADPSTLTEEQRKLQKKMQDIVNQLKVNEE